MRKDVELTRFIEIFMTPHSGEPLTVYGTVALLREHPYVYCVHLCVAYWDGIAYLALPWAEHLSGKVVSGTVEWEKSRTYARELAAEVNGPFGVMVLLRAWDEWQNKEQEKNQ